MDLPALPAPPRPAQTAPNPGFTGPRTADVSDRALWAAARQLETNFLATMLKSSGLEPREGPFSGGHGEQQFNSFLLDAQAERIVETGGIGLAESIFQALKDRK